MNHDLHVVRLKLNQRGFSIAGLARAMSEDTGAHFSEMLVNKALRTWVPRNDGIPRGKTLAVLLYASDAIGEPVSAAIRPIYKHAAKKAA